MNVIRRNMNNRGSLPTKQGWFELTVVCMSIKVFFVFVCVCRRFDISFSEGEEKCEINGREICFSKHLFFMETCKVMEVMWSVCKGIFLRFPVLIKYLTWAMIYISNFNGPVLCLFYHPFLLYFTIFVQ